MIRVILAFVISLLIFYWQGCGPHGPVYDSGVASCDEAAANAGHCEGLIAAGPDEDAGTEDDIPFAEWCNDAVYLDKASIAKAPDCDAAVECLNN